jgi:hypothetical protein
MVSDEWPHMVCKRFDGESEVGYTQRSTRINEIVWGFRFGHYRGAEAQVREEELLGLQEPEGIQATPYPSPKHPVQTLA